MVFCRTAELPNCIWHDHLLKILVSVIWFYHILLSRVMLGECAWETQSTKALFLIGFNSNWPVFVPAWLVTLNFGDLSSDHKPALCGVGQGEVSFDGRFLHWRRREMFN